MIPRGCDAELCPYWGGDGCLCAAFGIDLPGPEDHPADLPSVTYERSETRRDR